MLEIGGVVDSRREHRNHRPLPRPRRQRGQGFVQSRGVIVDRKDVANLEQLRKQAFHEQTVFEHVGHTRRHAQIVLQHVNGAVPVAHQIGAAYMCPHPKTGRFAHALRPEIARTFEQFARKYAVLDDGLLVVEVVDEQVQRGKSLFQARFDPSPLVACHNPRDDVEGPGAVDIRPVAVDGEVDAHGHDRRIHGCTPLVQFGRTQALQIIEQCPRRRTRLAVSAYEFIVDARQTVLIEDHLKYPSSEEQWVNAFCTTIVSKQCAMLRRQMPGQALRATGDASTCRLGAEAVARLRANMQGPKASF